MSGNDPSTSLGSGATNNPGFPLAAVYNTTPPAPISGQRVSLQADSQGNLLVNIAAGSAGGTQYVDGTTQATPTGTVALGKNPSNVLHAFALDTSGNLNVNVQAIGTVSVTFPSAQHVIVDSASLGTVAENLTQVAGTALGATAVVNFGTAPAAAAVPGVNASLFSGTTGLTNTSGALDVNLKSSGATVTVSGTVTANQGGAPWSVDVTDRAARLLGVVFGSQAQQLKQTATNFNLQVELATGGTLYDARQIRALTSADVVSAVQSGTWTVQPGNTPNTAPWLVGLSNAGNTAQVSATLRQRVQQDGTQSFYEAWDTGTIETVFNWFSAVTGNGGSSTPSAGQEVLATGTSPNAYAYLNSKTKFQPSSPGFLETNHQIQVTFPIPAHAYAFWGAGNPVAVPTSTAYVTDAVGFELGVTGVLQAVCWASGTKNAIATLTAIADGNVHRYQTYMRGDTIYWVVDNVTVASIITGALGPNTNLLPVLMLSGTDGTGSASNFSLTSAAVYVGDTSKANVGIRDPIHPQYAATVKPPSTLPVSSDSALVVASSSMAQETGNLAAIATQTRNNAQIVDLLSLVVRNLQLLNINVASSVPGADSTIDAIDGAAL